MNMFERDNRARDKHDIIGICEKDKGLFGFKSLN